MIKSKFFEIVKSFSRDELKEFNDFVRSPFHNSNKKVMKLYEIIRKTYPEFKSESLGKDKVFQNLYPGKKYNDTVMRILSSDLIRLGEEFLIIKKSRENQFAETLLLLEELSDRAIDSLYQKNFKSIEGILKNIEDARSRYLSKFELEVINVHHHLKREKQQMICRNVLDRAENLIYFALIELVRNVHDLIINERTFNAKFDFNLVYEFFKCFDFGGLINKIKINRPEYYPSILIMYNLLMALIHEENETYYDNLKNSVENNFDKLSRNEISFLLNDMESCCLNRMKYNTEKYRHEIFHVYELMLSSGCYSIAGTDDMSFQRFKNILMSGVNLNKIEWVESFVGEYIWKVQPEFRENMRYYSYALIYFSRKNFEKSLEYITKVKYDYFTLKLDAKSWMLKNYYELGYWETAVSFVDSYRHFLNKNKSLSEHFKERHYNYLKFTADLLKIKQGTSRLSADELRNGIEKTINVVNKDWMLEKAADLKNSRSKNS
jgi:hypothetical protein